MDIKALLNNSFVKTIFGLGVLFGLVLGVFLMISGDKILRQSELVAINDYHLDVRDYGKGSPTVIIEPGLNCSKHLYYGLQYRTSRKTRVIAYDHAGIGESTPNNNPRTLPYYIEELRALMDAKDLEPPYILIGHSLGGHIIRYFTYLYPEKVAGLIFIDHPHEDWFRHIRATWDVEEATQYFKFWSPDTTGMDPVPIGHIEKFEYEANCDSIRGKKIPTNIPVLMFTGKNARHFRKHEKGLKEDMKAWADLQHSLLEGLSESKHIVDWETGHSLHLDKPQMVQKEINAFIERCSSKQ